MQTFEALEARYASEFPAGRARGQLDLIVVRLGAGLHETPGRARISAAEGVDGDRWTVSEKRDVRSQVTLMNRRIAEWLDKLHAGCKKFGERFGQDALRWVNWHEHRVRRLRGVNCRVVEDGTVAVGDAVEILYST